MVPNRNIENYLIMKLVRLIFINVITLISLLNVSANTPMSAKFADSEISRHPDVYGSWDYVTGTVLVGFEMVWRQTGDKKYFDYIKTTVDKVLDENGKLLDYHMEEYNIDEIAEGRLLLMLYKETGEEKYKIAADAVRKQFEKHPRTTEGGFFHKAIYPSQMWLDGLYMGSPFYAEYSAMFKKTKDFDDITNQFLLIDKYLYDENTGLFFHAWDESKKMFWADKETGLSPNFWSRGMGWYAMALVDVLDALPENHKDRAAMVNILNKMAKGLKKYQDKETGLWWQVTDQGERFGNYLEGSGSSMFVYALAKGVRLNLIDKAYYEVAKKGYDGLLKYLVFEDGMGRQNLTRICRSAGVGGNYSRKTRDGSFEYYCYMEPIIPNDGKGTGPFLMACVEIEMAEGKK